MDFEIQEEQIKAEVIKSVRANAKLSHISLRETSVFMIIVSAFVRAILVVVNPVLKSVYESIFIQTANKYNLQRRLNQESLPGFKPPARAETLVKIGSGTRPTQEINIPQGAIVKTTGDNPIEFSLLEAGVLNASTQTDAGDEYTIRLKAQSILEGPEYNILVDSLVELDEDIEGIDIVTNPGPAIGGREEETIQSARERLLTKKTGQVIGLIDWFKSQAESIDGVLRAKLVRKYENEEGKIGILIVSPGGPASEKIIQKVQTHFDHESRNPAGAWHVVVAAPKTVKRGFTIAVFYDRYNSSEPSQEDVKKVIRNYMSSLDIGSDIVLSALSAALISDLSIKDVSITEPTGNVTVEANQLAVEDLAETTITIKIFTDA